MAGSRAGGEVLTWGAAAGLLAAFVTVPRQSPDMFWVGVPVTVVCTVALIGVVTRPGSLSIRHLLDHGVLVHLGMISYGAYLWHGLTFQLLSENRTGLTGWALLGVQCAATVAMAEVSWRLVEVPIRTGRIPIPAPAVTWPAVGAVMAVALLAAGIGAISPLDYTTAGKGGWAMPAGDSDAPRLLFVGDSVAFSLALPASAMVDRLDVGVADRAEPGCELLFQTHRIHPNPAIEPDRPARPCGESWAEDVATLQPDVVLLVLGLPPVHEAIIDGQRRDICSAELGDDARRRLESGLDVLGSRDATVVVATIPYPAVEGFEAVRERTDCANALLAEATEGRDDTRMVDLAGMVCSGDGCEDPRPDGLHFAWPGVGSVVEQLVPVVMDRRPEAPRGADPSLPPDVLRYCEAAGEAWAPVNELPGAILAARAGTGPGSAATVSDALNQVDLERLRATVEQAPTEQRPVLRTSIDELERRLSKLRASDADPATDLGPTGDELSSEDKKAQEAAVGYLGLVCRLDVFATSRIL